MGTVIYLRQHGVRRSDDAPIAAMNITPLIDVMLVLLVMLIITLPMTLHKVDVDLPVKGTVSERDPVIQRLAVAADGITYWNGVAVDDTRLATELKSAAAAGDDLEFQTDANARYERFDKLVAMVKRSGITQIGFAGNSAFASFGKQASQLQ